jgi:hypothetical protein
MNDMKIVMVDVNEIKPYKNNAKKHPPEQVANIAQSIEAYGFRQPIVVDKEGVIIIGHGRYLAAKHLGKTEVPVHYADDLPAKKVKELRLLDNKLNESDWDYDLLKLDMDGLDFGDMRLDWGVEKINPDEFGEEFTLPDGAKSEFCQMTFTLHNEQAELIKYAMTVAKEYITETFGNTNSNGNAIYEVVRQWAEQRK